MGLSLVHRKPSGREFPPHSLWLRPDLPWGGSPAGQREGGGRISAFAEQWEGAGPRRSGRCLASSSLPSGKPPGLGLPGEGGLVPGWGQCEEEKEFPSRVPLDTTCQEQHFTLAQVPGCGCC